MAKKARLGKQQVHLRKATIQQIGGKYTHLVTKTKDKRYNML